MTPKTVRRQQLALLGEPPLPPAPLRAQVEELELLAALLMAPPGAWLQEKQRALHVAPHVAPPLAPQLRRLGELL
jgi:hypothetical protein